MKKTRTLNECIRDLVACDSVMDRIALIAEMSRVLETKTGRLIISDDERANLLMNLTKTHDLHQREETLNEFVRKHQPEEK